MDLTRTNSQEIGSVLDRAGVTWNYDRDGDIRVRFRAGQPPWIDTVFYEFDTTRADWSMRGEFLNGRAIPQSDGTTRWEVPPTAAHSPTAVAQKVVDVYIIPAEGGLMFQIHAAIVPLKAQPPHIKITPSAEQVGRIERQTGFKGVEGDRLFWLAGGYAAANVEEADFVGLVSEVGKVGLAMFDGPFTGWAFTTEV